MRTLSPSDIEIARMADLRARQYILIEKLDRCTTGEEFLSLSRELDIISHHLECIKVRQTLRGSNDEPMKMRAIRSSKEFNINKTTTNAYKRSLSHS